MAPMQYPRSHDAAERMQKDANQAYADSPLGRFLHEKACPGGSIWSHQKARIRIYGELWLITRSSKECYLSVFNALGRWIRVSLCTASSFTRLCKDEELGIFPRSQIHEARD